MQVEAFLAYADCAGGRLQAQGLLDHGGRVFELVEEMSIGFQLRGGLRWVRAEDFIVLGADAGEHGGIFGEVVVGVADCGTRRVVAGEEESFDVGDCGCAEGWVHVCDFVGVASSGFLEVGFEGEVDDILLPLAACGFVAGGASGEAIVEESADVAVHFEVVPG